VAGLAALVWLALPLWAAGQGLGSRLPDLLGRPAVREPPALPPASVALVTGGLLAAVWLLRRHPAGPRLLAWTLATAAGALLAAALGWPVQVAAAFAVPAAAVTVATAGGEVVARLAGRVRLAPAAAAAVLLLLLAGQALDWTARYGGPDRALGGLADAASRLGSCQVVQAAGADARARLLAGGMRASAFASAPDAAAHGVRDYVLGRGGGADAAWVRGRGRLLLDEPSRSLGRVQLWQVDPSPFDPAADSLPVPGGIFANVSGSACGGYRVVDAPGGGFYAGYQALGGKAVVGRPLASPWTTDGPTLQAFDTLFLGTTSGERGTPPAVQPVDLLLLVELLHPDALAAARLPGRTVNPPTTDAGLRRLLTDPAIARAYLGGVDPATATAADRRRARDRFGRPVGLPRRMPDGAVRQAFERVVFERPAAGGPARLAPLGRVAAAAGLVPAAATRLQPVPGLPPPPVPVAADARAFAALLAAALALVALAGVLAARTSARRPGASPATP
jgi:hypothetical protein